MSQATTLGARRRWRAVPDRDRVPVPIAMAVFLACYLSWRPSRDIMFTASDMLFLLGGWILLTRKRLPAEPLGPFTAPWLIAFTTMLGGLLIGSVASGSPDRWTIVAIQYMFAWVVLPFLLIGHGHRYTMVLARMLFLGVVAMELVGVIVYSTFNMSFEASRELLGLDFISGSRRLGVFATDANWNGAVIAMTLPFAFYLASKKLIGPIFAVVSIAILVSALAFSASFTAFSASVVAIVIFLTVGAVRPRPWAVLLVLAAGSLVATGEYTPEIFQKRVGDAIETGDINEAGTFTGRVALIADAWEMAGDHLLVGIGVDQDRVVSKLRAPVHNMYLLVLVEGGAAALLGWVGMMLVGLATAISAFRHDRLVAAVALSVLTTFLIISTASPHMYARLWAVPLLVALAVARDASMQADEVAPTSRRRLFATRFRTAHSRLTSAAP